MKQSRIKALYRLERELRGDGYEVVMRINLAHKTLMIVIGLSDRDIEQFSIDKMDTPPK